MLRVAVMSPRALASAAAAVSARTSGTGMFCRRNPFLSPPSFRFFSGGSSNADPVALQMINYALTHARSLKSDDSYDEAQLVLEQCLSNHPDDSSEGMALLAMSTLLSERAKFNEAIERLKRIHENSHSSIGVKVAALEALVGIHLELGQDDTSSVLADKCLQLLEEVGSQGSGGNTSEFHVRARAVKGLVELVNGDLESAELLFQGCQDDKQFGSAALSYGIFLHAKQDFSKAREFYQKVIQEISGVQDSSDPHALAACNMSSDEVLLAANCALGQLEVHLGNFEDAQDVLSQALTKAEENFGSRHPRVGAVLTAVALMCKHKARLEHSSSILIQEGLFRRAIELLKAPPLETTEGAKEKVARRDIVALARGGYAEVLCIQQNRKNEGDKMKNWAESVWKHHRSSLAEALQFSDSSKPVIIDTRISRAL